MDYLQLCQRVRFECGIAGEGLPSATAGQTGVMNTVVNLTARAWVDIQTSRPYWKFARATLTFPTVAAQRTYSVVSDLSHTDVDKWNYDSAFIYLTSNADRSKLTWKDYDEFNRRVNPTFPDGRPTIITESPGRNLAFDRTPDDIYTITIDYWKTPELLASDTDVPAIPEHFHDVIVWKAVMAYAGPRGMSERYQNARAEYIKMYGQLVIDQGDLPSQVKSYPIAGMRRGRR